MTRFARALPFLTALVVAAVACGETEPPVADEPGDPQSAAGELLPRPFTAEQIRDEMVEGWSVLVEETGPQGTSRQHWEVTYADADGVLIAYRPFDADGKPLSSAPEVRESWTELRDHASFPKRLADRRRETRETALGELEGWVYRTKEPDRDVVRELFFADSLPGAPIEITTWRDGEIVQEWRQLERSKPGA